MPEISQKVQNCFFIKFKRFYEELKVSIYIVRYFSYLIYFDEVQSCVSISKTKELIALRLSDHVEYSV